MRPEAHKPGLVQHTLGWPLDDRTGGGSFLYHYGANLVSVGFVVHLNYSNPLPVALRRVPALQDPSGDPRHFEGGKRIAYGARALTEGGWQSIPQPGVSRRRAGRLRGGLHERAAHQGLAQRHAVGHRRRRGGVRGASRQGRAHDRLEAYEDGGHGRARSRATCAACATPSRCCPSSARCSARVSPASTCGSTRCCPASASATRSSTASRTTRRSSSGSQGAADRLSQARRRADLRPADQRLVLGHQPRGGPAGPPEGRRHGPAEALGARCLSPGRRAAIARPGVYEWVEEAGQPRFVINAQNCVHCKTCDIKDPNQNITWVRARGRRRPELSGHVRLALRQRADMTRSEHG